MSNMVIKTAIVMTLGDPSNDPRPNRMINLLKSQGLVVDVMSHPSKKDLNIRHHLIIPLKYSFPAKVKRRLIRYIVRLVGFLPLNVGLFDKLNRHFFGFNNEVCHPKTADYNLIVVEDLFLLPLAFEVKKNAKVIFDAREYYPRQSDESLWWRLTEKPVRQRFCRSYLHKVDLMLTVSPGLAMEYEKEFAAKPVVYRSTPKFCVTKPTKTPSDKIRLVHHGIANKNRQLHKMIDVVALLDERFTFDMYLTGDSSYIRSLRRHALKSGKVRVLQPVDFDSLHSMLVGYDVGFYFLMPSGFNVTYNLPNKLFEFIQARLAVAIGPSPDMSALVCQYQCGVVAKNFSIEAMASVLENLRASDVDRLKANSDLAAKELNFEVESQVFLNALRRIR